MEILKKNPAGLEESKKISSSLKILQPPWLSPLYIY